MPYEFSVMRKNKIETKTEEWDILSLANQFFLFFSRKVERGIFNCGEDYHILHDRIVFIEYVLTLT